MSEMDDVRSSGQLLVDAKSNLATDHDHKPWVITGPTESSPRCRTKHSGSNVVSLKAGDLGIFIGPKTLLDFDIELTASFSENDQGQTVVTWTPTNFFVKTPGEAVRGFAGISETYRLSVTSIEGSIATLARSNNDLVKVGAPCDGGKTLLVSLDPQPANSALTISISGKREGNDVAFSDTDDFTVTASDMALDATMGMALELIAEIGPVALSPVQWIISGDESKFRALVTGVPAGRTPSFAWTLTSDGDGHFSGDTTEPTCFVKASPGTTVTLKVEVRLLDAVAEAHHSYTVPPRYVLEAVARFRKSTDHLHLPRVEPTPKFPIGPGDPAKMKAVMIEGVRSLRAHFAKMEEATVQLLEDLQEDGPARR